MDLNSTRQPTEISEPKTSADKETGITLRFCDIPANLTPTWLLLSKAQMEEIKDTMLATLKIERQPGEKHLSAWLRAMSTENGMEYSKPAHPAIANAVMWHPEIARFVWVLA